MKNRQGMRFDTKDYDGFKQAMIEQLKIKIPEYSDFSETDMGIVLIELLAYGLDTLSFYNDKIANELYLETAMETESILKLTKLIGYSMYHSKPAKYKQVFEIEPQKTDFTIPKGTVLHTEGDLFVTFEMDHDLIIPANKSGLEVENGEYLYAAAIIEGETISNEICGDCIGIPNFKLNLNYYPVEYDSIEIFIDEGFGFKQWNKVNNFIDSNSNSLDYVVNLKDNGIAEITFGNGVSGKIPETLNDSIIANYRVSNGTKGNVGINSITKIPSKLAHIKRTFNPNLPYEKGRDRESIENARIQAPAQLGTKWGLVTLNDFKNHALNFESILRSNLTTERETINIYYLADGSIKKEILEQQLIDSYNEKRVLGTKVYIYEGTEIPLNLNIYVKTFNYLNNNDVKEEIETFINNYINKGKYDFTEIPETSDILIDILGLLSVRSAEVTFKGNKPTLKPNEIFKLGSVDIEIVGGKNE